jgi:hypothetical protein
MSPPFGKRSKDRLGAAKDSASGQNQMHGLLQISPWNFRKATGDLLVLEWKIIDGVACGIFPTGDPSAAELAIAVKNH